MVIGLTGRKKTTPYISKSIDFYHFASISSATSTNTYGDLIHPAWDYLLLQSNLGQLCENERLRINDKIYSPICHSVLSGFRRGTSTKIENLLAFKGRDLIMAIWKSKWIIFYLDSSGFVANEGQKLKSNKLESNLIVTNFLTSSKPFRMSLKSQSSLTR